MVKSMTGFATLKGDFGGWSWTWDMRAVNARGLDIRLRLPDWIEGLEARVRRAVSEAVNRGNVTVGLKVQRAAEEAAGTLDSAGLIRVLGQIAEVEAVAAEHGITLARSTAVEVLTARGVVIAVAPDDDGEPLGEALAADLPRLVQGFDKMRRDEGSALAAVIEAQIARIADLAAEAASLAEARKEQMSETLRANLARVLDNSDGADPDRVAQELALIAVKSDVTEEIDRLSAHVGAARELLAAKGPIGRKLDFLTQEFNREANTLCSKAQSADLTRVGLDLKAVIDQMREQVQNVE